MKTCVARASFARVALVNNLYARILLCICITNGTALVGRPVIHQNNLYILIGLRGQAVDAANQVFFRVINWNADGDDFC
ncbi:hypothetical protein SDC9_163010 [bioreactor metagenome]|uniref:Uncharacterized protein n=1 Tax=bioreactor metagenome TaxID=1076179 RepID=A0A645FPN5_9ZZZZ